MNKLRFWIVFGLTTFIICEVWWLYLVFVSPSWTTKLVYIAIMLVWYVANRDLISIKRIKSDWEE